ncbi:MAG: ABC transporter ATP-binding protein [Rhizobiaceae bacterium]|nr:ABC transporter ATP-binding protein [Rhizobiaceae bacterium]
MIEVENLSFTYPGATGPTLAGLNFSIADGEVYGLLGPSGAGKSTTQRILMGLLGGFSGEARVFGQPVGSMGREFYERIGVSFELPTLYLRLTARENLKLFAALYDRPTRDPLDVLGLVDLADAADQRVETFSKGMKMRLNLCRALLHDPDLLFLDEPTTGQDPARARMTRALILRLKAEGKTVFLTTHNMAEADEICDRVGFLAHGHIPVTGKPEALKREYGQRVLEVTTRAGDGLDKASFPMDGIGVNEDFRSLIASTEVVSMHTLEASLDDVFIKATGIETGPPE